MRPDIDFDEESEDGIDLGVSFWANVRAYLDPVGAAAAAASSAITSNYSVPVPDRIDPLTGKPQAYLPFQLAGIEYIMNRKDTLNSDQMGTGKSIQAIGAVNADPLAHRVLILCPAFLKNNWYREFKKWDVKNLSAGIVKKNKKESPFPCSDVVITSHELMQSWREDLRKQEWDTLIVDECHYLKNKKAARTREVFGCRKYLDQERIEPIRAQRRIFLSGTPLLKKPKELWPLIQSFDPKGLGSNQRFFDKRYCDGHFEAIVPKSRLTFNGVPIKHEDLSIFKKVWDNEGATNSEELQQYLRSKFMIRRLRSQVLPWLKETQRQVVVLDIDNISGALKQEHKLYDEYGDNLANLKIDTPEFAELSRAALALGIKKVPFMIDRTNEALEDTSKICLFVHHHEVIDLLAAEFAGHCVVVDGRVDPDDRQALVDRFQTDPSINIFLATIDAAGVGYTLVAAWFLIFGELDWNPSAMRQVEDRLNRMGQTEEVHAMYLVANGSLDERKFQLLVEKQEIADRTLDTI